MKVTIFQLCNRTISIRRKRRPRVTLALFILILCVVCLSDTIGQKNDFYSKSVELFNHVDSVTLAGTLIAPDSTGTFPLAVFISGSGPQDRFSTIGRNRPFLEIAKEIEKIGVASLSFDDRGTGKSSGSKFTSTMEAELLDHRLIIESIPTLLANDSIHFSSLGLIGHSLGGMVALELSRTYDLDFRVLLATPFEKGYEMMLKQKKNMEQLMPDISDQQINVGVENLRTVYEVLIGNPDHIALDSLLTESFHEIDTGNHLSPTTINGLVYQMTQTYLKDILLFDPMRDSFPMDIPSLFVYGSKDLQVPPDASISNLDLIIQDDISPIDYVLFGNLNHMLQKSKDGSPMDYWMLDEPINELPLNTITFWLKQTLDK